MEEKSDVDLLRFLLEKAEIDFNEYEDERGQIVEINETINFVFDQHERLIEIEKDVISIGD